MIDEKIVRHIAHLARIGVSDEEVAALTKELGAVLRFVETLSETDTRTGRVAAHATDIVNALREDGIPAHPGDERVPQALRADLLEEQAPGHVKGEVRVPRILE